MEQPEGILAVIAGGDAAFVQDHLLRFPIGSVVTPMDGPEVLPLPLLAHRNPPQDNCESSYILQGAMTTPLSYIDGSKRRLRLS